MIQSHLIWIFRVIRIYNLWLRSACLQWEESWVIWALSCATMGDKNVQVATTPLTTKHCPHITNSQSDMRPIHRIHFRCESYFTHHKQWAVICYHKWILPALYRSVHMYFACFCVQTLFVLDGMDFAWYKCFLRSYGACIIKILL